MPKTLTAASIPFSPAVEQLGHTAPLHHSFDYPLLGVPVRLRSNSQAVLEAAERSFGRWQRLPSEHVAVVPPRGLDVIVHPTADGTTNSASREPFVHRMHGDVFMAASASNLMTAYLAEGKALAFVTPEMVADDVHFRYSVLECLSLLLATAKDRTPVHAGAVVWNGQAVLLMGQSTVGKSTLCYACVRQGFQLLDEDVVYVSLHGGLKIWGTSSRIHLLPDAQRHFPELDGIPPQIQANGKLKMAIETAPTNEQEGCFFAQSALLCMLERRAGGDSSIQEIDPASAIAAISQSAEPGFDFARGKSAAARALVENGVHRLCIGSDLDRAVQLLKSLTSESE
jgi:hypothetical protein